MSDAESFQGQHVTETKYNPYLIYGKLSSDNSAELHLDPA